MRGVQAWEMLLLPASTAEENVNFSMLNTAATMPLGLNNRDDETLRGNGSAVKPAVGRTWPVEH